MISPDLQLITTQPITLNLKSAAPQGTPNFISVLEEKANGM